MVVSYQQGVATIWEGYSRVSRIVGVLETIALSVVLSFILRVLLLTFASVITDFLRVLLLTETDSIWFRSSSLVENSFGELLVRLLCEVLSS